MSFEDWVATSGVVFLVVYGFGGVVARYLAPWRSRRRVAAEAEKQATIDLKNHAWAAELEKRWSQGGPSSSYPSVPREAWIIATQMMDAESAWSCLTWLVAANATRFDDRLREAALDEAVKRDRWRAPELLEKALGDPALRIKIAAIVHLGRLRHRLLAGKVVELLPRLDPGGRHAVARALSRMNAAEHEATLIALLSDETPRVRTAAAESLGWIGTIAAVEPLRQLGGEVAARATGRIQARARGEAGRVSVSSDEEVQGRLSPAEIAGQLSITAKK